jgi:protein phosphatase
MAMDLLFVAVPLLALVASIAFLLRELWPRHASPGDSTRERSSGNEPGEDPVLRVTGTGRTSLPDLTLDADPASEIDLTPSTAVTLFDDDAAHDEPSAPRKMIVVCASGRTDPGLARSKNEDAILLLPEEQVFVIADGMGGYAGGDLASKLAVDAIESMFRERRFPEGSEDARRPRRASELVWAIEEANRRIRHTAKTSRLYEQMGATLISARFSENKQRAFIGYVGDSRCYRLRDGQLRLLTQDHTLARYGVTGTMGARVRRALGVNEHVSVDVFVDKPMVGDVYVLCSDGLNKMLDDAGIARILTATSDDLDQGARRLVDAANEAGGKDNVSVILVGVRSPPTPSGYCCWTAS